MADERTQIVIADDNLEILEAVKHILQEDFQVIGAIDDAHYIVRAVSDLKPDVLILDISMSEFNGFEITQQLKLQQCPSKIIFLTVHEELEFIRGAFDVGASGYVFKSRMNTDLHAAINTVRGGGIFIPQAPIP